MARGINNLTAEGPGLPAQLCHQKVRDLKIQRGSWLLAGAGGLRPSHSCPARAPARVRVLLRGLKLGVFAFGMGFPGPSPQCTPLPEGVSLKDTSRSLRAVTPPPSLILNRLIGPSCHAPSGLSSTALSLGHDLCDLLLNVHPPHSKD